MRTLALSLIAGSISTCLLSGCGVLTGFSNAHSEFTCADISGKPSCKNITAIYNEDHLLDTNGINSETAGNGGKLIPASSKKEERCPGGCASSNLVTASGEAVQTAAVSTPLDTVVEVKAVVNSGPAVSSDVEGYVSSVDYAVISPFVPWRKPETILRVWMAPFTDRQGDLHDQRYLYVKILDATWSTPSIDEMAKVRSPFRPVYPLSVQKEEAPPPKQENPLNFLKAASAS